MAKHGVQRWIHYMLSYILSNITLLVHWIEYGVIILNVAGLFK